jgi:predicted PurR-regulated permease PerM
MQKELNSAHIMFMAICATAILYFSKSILLPIIFSIFLWYIINTLAFGFSSLSKKVLRFENRSLSLFLAAIFSFGIFAGTIYIISENVGEIAARAPFYNQQLRALSDNFGHIFKIDVREYIDKITKSIDLPQIITPLITAFTNSMASLGLVLIYLLFIFLEQSSWKNKIAALEKINKNKNLSHTLENITHRLKLFMLLKTLSGIVTGIISYIVLKSLNIDFAEFWAVLIFIFNYIPTVGAFISCAPPALLALLQYGMGYQFVTLTSLLIFIQILLGNFIEPRIMGENLNLSPLVILISLVVWGTIWGVAGMFLCIPLTVSILIILAQFKETKKIAILLSSDGKV